MVFLADQTGPNCGRPVAHVRLSVVRVAVRAKGEPELGFEQQGETWYVRPAKPEGEPQPILVFEYAGDALLGLDPLGALVLTAAEKNVKPDWVSANINTGPLKTKNILTEELFYRVKPEDLNALAQAATVQGRLRLKKGECDFQFLGDAGDRIRSFLASGAPR